VHGGLTGSACTGSLCGCVAWGQGEMVQGTGAVAPAQHLTQKKSWQHQPSQQPMAPGAPQGRPFRQPPSSEELDLKMPPDRPWEIQMGSPGARSETGLGLACKQQVGSGRKLVRSHLRQGRMSKHYPS